MDSTERKVHDILEREEAKARDVYRTVSADGSRAQNDDERRSVLLKFLDGVPIRRNQFWSNLPQDVKLSHYLLCGVPVTFDLHRWASEQDVELQTGLTIRALEECYETRGHYLSFNLYMRDSTHWAKHQHLENLIDRSVANGIRVDYFIRAICPAFECIIAKKKNDFERIRRDRPVLWSALEARVKQPTTDEKIKWLSYQWAYLDVFCKDALRDIDKMLQVEQIGEALELLSVAKRLYVSPFSGAIGGEWVWSGKEWSWYKRWKLQEHPYLREEVSTKPDQYIHSIANIDPRACEYVIHELAKCPAITILDKPEVANVMQVLRRSDWPVLRQEIFQILTDLTALLQKREMDGIEKGISDLKKHLEDQRKILEKCKVTGESITVPANVVAAVAAVGAPLTYHLGILPNPVTAAVIGAIGGTYGIFRFAVGERVSAAKIGEWIFRLGRPLHHKIFARLDELHERIAH